MHPPLAVPSNSSTAASNPPTPGARGGVSCVPPAAPANVWPKPGAVTMREDGVEIDGADGRMHRDAQYAKETVWGKLTVHGLLTLSIALVV